MSNERFQSLLTDFLEGELSDVEMSELHALIESDDAFRETAIQSYRLHRMLGLLMEQQMSMTFLETVMKGIPQGSDSFVQIVLKSIQQKDKPKDDQDSTIATKVTSAEPARSDAIPTDSDFSHWLNSPATRWFAIALALVASLAAVFYFGIGKSLRFHDSRPDVVFKSTAHARFLGEFSPPIGSRAQRSQQYVLRSGSVELRFPNGAEAIIAGPSVFRIATTDSMVLIAGSCSVHAPPGAEGFYVDTPSVRVVDRGTRFALTVADTSGTEVHVVEGAAEVYPAIGTDSAGKSISGIQGKPDSSNAMPTRLNRSEAKLFKDGFLAPPESTTFRPSLYSKTLPDRCISYVASKGENGGAEELVSVRIQRGGKAVDYGVEELIPVQLTWFKCGGIVFDETKTRVRHMASRQSKVLDRQSLLSDRFLNTGAINPGGATVPTQSDPILKSDDPNTPTTPGMAFRFERPVVNQVGPDVILFELQHLTGIQDGDSFHVVPLQYKPHLRPKTVKAFDLTLTSSETNRLADFFLTEYDDAVDSLNDFLEGSGHSLRTPQPGHSYGLLAVAIDLSDLGYTLHETVDGLFFQDTLDDEQRFDPVFIAGLP